MRIHLGLVLLLTSCSGSDPAEQPADAGTNDAPAHADGDPPCEPRDEVVTFETDDGLALEADLRSGAAPGEAAVVLLHMIPPSNDRTNYPLAFVDALAGRGLTVLNVDRRGAGGSEGDAMDAYVGPSGALDAKAAFDFLSTIDCPPDPARIGIVGASNGTTTALDYAVLAAADDLTPPAALVFLTGGTYTENNNAVADHRATLDPLPILFEFASNEAIWSASFVAGAPSSWTFDERDVGSGHGTNMFAADTASIGFVADFVAGAL
jgi:pimeloyl-ACP methyl ester carboxylesterase